MDTNEDTTQDFEAIDFGSLNTESPAETANKKEDTSSDAGSTQEKNPPVQKDTKETLTPLEQQAYNQGWRPKEEYIASGNDPASWKEAGWWLDRGALLGQHSQLRRELKQVKDAFIKMTEYNRNAYLAGQRDTLKQLKEERKAAMKNNDLEAVAEYDDRIDQQQEVVTEMQARIREPILPKEERTIEHTALYQNWLSANKWYTSDRTLHRFANATLAEYASENPNATPEDCLQYVSDTIRQKFPNEFSGTPKVSQPPVGGKGNQHSSNGASGEGSSSVEAKFKKILGSLDNDSKQMALNMVRSKVMTMEEYVKDFNEVS